MKTTWFLPITTSIIGWRSSRTCARVTTDQVPFWFWQTMYSIGIMEKVLCCAMPMVWAGTGEVKSAAREGDIVRAESFQGADDLIDS